MIFYLDTFLVDTLSSLDIIDDDDDDDGPYDLVDEFAQIDKDNVEELQTDETQEINYEQIKDCFYEQSAPWGGKIVKIDHIPSSSVYSDYNMVNTCSIDYLLYALWLSYQLSNKVIYLINFQKNILYSKY